MNSLPATTSSRRPSPPVLGAPARTPNRGRCCSSASTRGSPALPAAAAPILAAFFGDGLDGRGCAGTIRIASRWRNTGRTRRFFSDDLARRRRCGHQAGRSGAGLPGRISTAGIRCSGPVPGDHHLPAPSTCCRPRATGWPWPIRSKGRFPFLDHRVVEFCNRLPPRLKLRGLTEKYLLKRLSRRWLPEEIWRRPKRPYPRADPPQLLQRRPPRLRRGAAVAGADRRLRPVQAGGGAPAAGEGRSGPAAGRNRRHGAGRASSRPSWWSIASLPASACRRRWPRTTTCGFASKAGRRPEGGDGNGIA